MEMTNPVSATTLNENLIALARRDPALAEKLHAATVSLSGVSVETSSVGKPYLRLRTGSIDMPMENPEDPAREARQKISELPQETRLIIIKGAGLGYLWKAAQAGGSGRAFERIVCIEPQTALFALMLSVTDMRRMLDDPRVEIHIGGDAGDVIRDIKNSYDFGTEPGKILVVLPPHASLRHPAMALSAEYDAIFSAEFSAMELVSDRNRATLERFADTWRGHILENLAAILDSGAVKALRGIASGSGSGSGMPGILVGAGPSLDKNVHALKKASGRAFIVAVDTAYRTLKLSGIIPDFVISVDATEKNVADFDGVIVGDDPTALVMVPVIHPSIPKLFSKRFVAGYGHPLQKWIERVLDLDFGSLLVSGSVATIGYDLLRFMGARPIIFAGTDLAVTTRTHARAAISGGEPVSRFSTGESLSRESVQSATIRTPAWGAGVSGSMGGTVRTTEQMLRWAQWFETEIVRQPWPTINATEGGSRIQGTTEMTLSDAIERHAAGRVFVPTPKPVPQDRRENLYRALGRLLDENDHSSKALDEVLSWERAVDSGKKLEAAKRSFLEIARKLVTERSSNKEL